MGHGRWVMRPEGGTRNALPLDPLPPLVAPQFPAAVTLVVHEREELCVRHRQRVDVECRYVNDMTIELVVPPERDGVAIGTEHRVAFGNDDDRRHCSGGGRPAFIGCRISD